MTRAEPRTSQPPASEVASLLEDRATLRGNGSFDFDLFARLLALRLGVAQRDNALALDWLSTIHPLEIHAYASGAEHNGWVVPHAWDVQKADVHHAGRRVFDGTSHPLGVIGYGSSFVGTVSKQELDRHVFYSEVFPDAFAFHCVNNYRPWASEWGLCIPWKEYQTWPDGSYQVDIQTSYTAGEMLVGSCLHEGTGHDTILLNAHLCHPCQANDDLSGVLVLMEFFRWISQRTTRYNYLGVVAPEHVGTVFFAADLQREDRTASIGGGVFLEMLGSTGPLTLQQSFTGDRIIDRVAEHVLRAKVRDLRVGPFRSIIGNDETVWEAPGVEIPTISISRWPYPEYHTSRDDLSIMSPASLDESLDVLKEMVTILEQDVRPRRNFAGLVALSNPKYALYTERPDPTVRKHLGIEDLRLGKLQDRLPRMLDGQLSVFDIADASDLPFDVVFDYLRRFEERGLVSVDPVSGLSWYQRGSPSPSAAEREHISARR